MRLALHLAVEHEGELVVNLWGGHQDALRTSPWQEDTLVNVWSVTKGVTATCIAKLINDGLLDPDEKVSKYWPEYGCNGKENTKVSDFLCHRAGMFGFQGGATTRAHGRIGKNLQNVLNLKPQFESLELHRVITL